MSQPIPPLTGGEKFAFGFGQIAEGIKTCAFGTFVLFYYNQVLGLSGELAGLAVALALLVDAVTDPIAGSISDRWQSRLGRRHPFLYASAIPLAVSFYLLFAPAVTVNDSGETALFIWMLATTVATRLSMTLYHVPHMALGAELSEDYDERTVLVATRHLFGATGFVLVYVLGFAVFFAPTEAHPNGQTNPEAYPPYALLMSAIMVVSIFYTAWGTQARIPHLPQPREREERVRISDVFTEAGQAMKNRSFRWMMIGFIIIFVAWGVAGATGLYMYTFFWDLDRFQILLVLIVGPLGSMVGYAFSSKFFTWLDKRDAMIWGGAAWMVIHATPVMLYLFGMAPEPGSWTTAVFLTLIIILAGATIAQLIVGIGTGMADIADENALLTGRRQEGVFFGASAFANKCAVALGSFLAGLILAYIEWPVGEQIRVASDIPAETLHWLAVISGPLVSLMAIPGLLCLRGYRLNRARVAEIQAELNA